MSSWRTSLSTVCRSASCSRSWRAVHWEVCTAALSTVRISLHKTPIDDPSAAKLSGALGPAATAVRIGLSGVSSNFSTVSLAANRVQRSQTNQD